MRLAIGRLLAVPLFWLAAACTADAGWREDLGTFRIGIVAEHGAGATVEGAGAIRNAYSQALGMPVEIFVARDFGALVDAQASSRIEYAVYSATAYATAWRLCSCVEPLVAPVAADGSTGIRSVLIARGDGPATADAATATRVAIGPAGSAGTHLLPLAEFAPGGVAMKGDEPWLTAAASDSEALEMLVDGRADAIFGFTPSSPEDAEPHGGSLDRLAELGVTDARVLWSSDLLRYGPHAVRANLPDEAKEALRLMLTGLAASSPEIYDLLERRRGGGFVDAVHEEYRTAIDLVRDIVARQATR